MRSSRRTTRCARRARLSFGVDIAAWSQAGTKESWSATAVEADEGGTAVAAAENNVRPGNKGDAIVHSFP